MGGGDCVKDNSINWSEWFKSLILSLKKQKIKGTTREDIANKIKEGKDTISSRIDRHIKKDYKLYNKKTLKNLIIGIDFKTDSESNLEVVDTDINCIAKEYKLSKTTLIKPIDNGLIIKFVDTKQQLKAQQELIDNFYHHKTGDINTLIDKRNKLQKELDELPDPIYGKINNNSITLVINKAAISNLLVH